jgi:hypothetical protein
MDEMNRYMITIIGSSKGIEKDLDEIADSEHGIDFVDSKVLFLGTFYSPYSTIEIHEKLVHRPAFLLFNITNVDNYGVNLPTKYYTGLFPEAQNLINNTLSEKPKRTRGGFSNGKSKAGSNQKSVEEYSTVNEILEKLSRNGYDRSCLTKNELEILDSQK